MDYERTEKVTRVFGRNGVSTVDSEIHCYKVLYEPVLYIRNLSAQKLLWINLQSSK